ncbi:MAG: chorismate synthase [Lentisphaeria bacterium]
MSSEFGKNIKFSVFGQSHGEAIGILIDGLPVGKTIDMDEVQAMMRRRAPGQSKLTTPRTEKDAPEILSGLMNHKTCGAPLCAIIRNTNTRSADYKALQNIPRPGHADYMAQLRYHGFQDDRGGGHFSGRLTAPLCLAGAICRQILRSDGVEIGAHIYRIGSVQERLFDPSVETATQILQPGQKEFPVLQDEIGLKMQKEILAAAKDCDSIGGGIECMAVGYPAGIGSPMFDGLENRLAQALFGIPAIKGVEFGAGFKVAEMRGSENNDMFEKKDGKIRTKTNQHGGILGGISSGMPIVFRVAMKPTPSISRPQQTLNLQTGKQEELCIHGRHDPCVVVRAVPVVEAVMAMVLLDMLQKCEL